MMISQWLKFENSTNAQKKNYLENKTLVFFQKNIIYYTYWAVMWLSHSVTLCYKAIKRAMSTVKNYLRDIIRTFLIKEWNISSHKWGKIGSKNVLNFLKYYSTLEMLFTINKKLKSIYWISLDFRQFFFKSAKSYAKCSQRQ